jgi:hypothetical protein
VLKKLSKYFPAHTSIKFKIAAEKAKALFFIENRRINCKTSFPCRWKVKVEHQQPLAAPTRLPLICVAT